MTEESEIPRSWKHYIPMLRQIIQEGETREGAIQHEGTGGVPGPQEEEGLRWTLVDTDS